LESVGLRVWRDAGTQNRSTVPSQRLPCYRYGMICHSEFIDKAILSFRKRLRSCVAAAAGRQFEQSV